MKGEEKDFIAESWISLCFFFHVGIWLELHDPDLAPFMLPISGFALHPGGSYDVKYEISTTYRLPEPYSSCSRNQDNESNERNKTIKYSPIRCVSLCLAKRILSTCGCIYVSGFIVWFKANSTVPYCEDINQPTGKLTEFSKCVELTKAPAMSQCPQLCSPTCTETAYKSTVSEAAWPTTRYHRSFYTTMIQNKSFQEDFDRYVSNTSLRTVISENFLKVSCYLGSHIHRILENTEKYTMTTLWSGFGAILNMWCGITFVFAVEIIDLFGNCLIELLSGISWRKRNQVHMINQQQWQWFWKLMLPYSLSWIKRMPISRWTYFEQSTFHKEIKINSFESSSTHNINQMHS